MKKVKAFSDNGSVLLPFVLIFSFLIIAGTLYLELSLNSFKLAKADQLRTHAQLSTDAGIEMAMQEINEDDSWTGTALEAGGPELELHNDGQIRTTYEVTVADSGSAKTVTSVGRAYSPAGSSSPSNTVTVKVNLRAITSGFSIVTGVGGLYLSNNSKIVGGDVLVNGEINLQNSAQIGLSTNPVDVQVAHQTCPDPPDANYPRLCASGENGEPISIQDSAHIYGDVKANNQTDGSDMSNPGLTASSGVPVGPLPSHDRDAQKAAALAPVSPYDTDWSCSSGSHNWPANLNITGDVAIEGSCVVTVNGDVWITGRLTIRNSSMIVVSDSLGTTTPDIMVDSSAGFLIQNSGKIQSNSSSTGVRLMTYWSRASCSPDCTSVTGTDLYSSREDRTIYLQNGADAPNSMLYARWTQVELSNGGSVGAVVGQTVRLSNSATITFGSSAGGAAETFWVIDGYRRVF